MLKEFFTFDKACANPSCHFKRLKGKASFKCNSEGCDKLVTVTKREEKGFKEELKPEVKRKLNLSLKKKVKNKIKIKF